MKKVEELSMLELKAHVYDLSNTLRTIQNEIQFLNQEIQRREQQEIAANPRTDQAELQQPPLKVAKKTIKKEEQ